MKSESKLLDEKISNLKKEFEDYNEYSFVKFEDLGLKIIRSKSDNSTKEEMQYYLENIASAIATIQTLENSDRVLAKFQMSKDLNSAISQTNIEIQREKEIAERKEVIEALKRF